MNSIADFDLIKHKIYGIFTGSRGLASFMPVRLAPCRGGKGEGGGGEAPLP
ncbi:hypothetical protein MBAV_002856 [Candidatus Magnetobacterium bavaricum]|uniref:Uncharacterized protein n=1 Tax=Candidatus Magnetobacterium bavaricum TaxID=29290 RepID=A0A0F3GSQ2_9BACT|nr:hypothetical protein MBAV_002856 [Candidatus Magnetobacterium bavaricum]